MPTQEDLHLTGEPNSRPREKILQREIPASPYREFIGMH